MIFGQNPNADQLLQLLGLSTSDFGRFRNVFVEGDYIVVYARIGGGNREDYEFVYDAMMDHPWFSHDEDDSFDYTYANLYFKIPDDKVKTLVKLYDQGIRSSDQWETLFKNFER